MTRVHANRAACVGSGMCVFISDKYFTLGDDPAVVEILQESVDEADRTVVEEAVDACPAGVLSLHED
ncbi:ferredoxin [Pseudonocardia kujensis]|uniref:ferredoxin n=1 Tax=Pseudonocardia kujensis TaxID=1128675 RepID=UPI001E3A3ADC|nr:ferredoxin [Pseudonocardia kujensis]MCE0763543.1 ferredoxin [Pseudonocardia kujensis]